MSCFGKVGRRSVRMLSISLLFLQLVGPRFGGAGASQPELQPSRNNGEMTKAYLRDVSDRDLPDLFDVWFFDKSAKAANRVANSCKLTADEANFAPTLRAIAACAIGTVEGRVADNIWKQQKPGESREDFNGRIARSRVALNNASLLDLRALGAIDSQITELPPKLGNYLNIIAPLAKKAMASESEEIRARAFYAIGRLGTPGREFCSELNDRLAMPISNTERTLVIEAILLVRRGSVDREFLKMHLNAINASSKAKVAASLLSDLEVDGKPSDPRGPTTTSSRADRPNPEKMRTFEVAEILDAAMVADWIKKSKGPKLK